MGRHNKAHTGYEQQRSTGPAKILSSSPDIGTGSGLARRDPDDDEERKIKASTHNNIKLRPE